MPDLRDFAVDCVKAKHPESKKICPNCGNYALYKPEISWSTADGSGRVAVTGVDSCHRCRWYDGDSVD